MDYVLDTNIVTFALKDQYGIKHKIIDSIRNGHTIIIPPITYFEITRGLLYANATNKIKLFENICRKCEYFEIDKETWTKAGYLYVDWRKRGRPTSDADLLQAAFCLRYDCTLVTNNIKDFEHFAELKIIDWSK